MALDTQIVPVNLRGGLDTKSDSKLSARLTLLENGVFTETDKIRKRNGYDAIGRSIVGSSSSISSGQALATFGDELVMTSSQRLYSYSPGADSWLDKSAIQSVKVGQSPVVRNPYTQTAPDVALVGGYLVYAWQDSRGGIGASVVEAETGAQLVSDTQLSSTGTRPRVLEVNGKAFVFYAEAANLRVQKFDPGSPLTFGAATTLQSDLVSATPYFDAEALNQYAVIAYHSGTAIKVFYMTDSGAVGTTAIGLPNVVTISEDPTNCLSIAVEETVGTIYVLWHSGTTGTRVTALRSDFTTLVAVTTIDSTTSPTTLRISAVPTSSSNLTVFYEVNATNSYDHYVKTATLTTAGVVSSSSVLKRSVGLASRAFLHSSKAMVNVAYESTLQATYFAMLADGTLVAKLQPGQGGGLPSIRRAPAVVSLSNSKIGFAALVKTKIVTENNTTFTVTGVSLLTLEFDFAGAFRSAQMGENLHFVGGIFSIYDGVSVVEHGFHLFPENITATPATSGGSIADGTYLYYCVWEWTDNRGQIHRSAPSVAVTATVSGGSGSGKNTLSVPTLRLTAKTGARANAILAVYRTKASQSAVAYKVSSSTSPTFNDPTVDSISFEDTLADSSIASREILYTTGGSVENIAPPACSYVDVFQTRMLLAGLEDELSIWYSKYKIEGEAVAFYDGFTIRANRLGGPVVVAKMMDDKIIIFKRSRLSYVGGEGPLDTGEQNTFTQPIEISSDVGIVDPASAVLTPAGLMFKSAKGIYLLTRGLEVKYIGADVEAYNAQTITSAEVIEGVNQVRFLTSSGKTLMFDYVRGQWSTFTNHEGLGATIWDDNYCYLRSDGKVYRESSVNFRDENLEYRLRIGTAWIKMAGVQGYQRVRRAAILGDYRSSHVLQMKVGYDYDETYPDSYYFAAGDVLDQDVYGDDATFGETVYGGVVDNVYQFRTHLRRQKCEAVRFLFEDVTAGTPGEGYSLSDLSLEIGIKKGLAKLRAQKSVG